MKFYLAIIFQLSLSLNFAFSCSFIPQSFCKTSEVFEESIIVSGVINSVDDDGINFEILQLLRGDETRSNIRIWDGTDFDCNGPFPMNAARLGNLNDTLILILPKIDSIENTWDIINDYRTPNFYLYAPGLKVEKNTVTGFISGDFLAPPEFNLLSFDYPAFINSWFEIGNCSKIVNTKETDTGIGIVVLSPNPANDFIKLESNENLSRFNIKIFNQLGNEVFSMKNLNDHSEIPIANLPKGVYYLFVEEKNLKISFVKL